jgi:hypothetical protein
MAIETFTNIDGIECVQWTDEQGNHSMLKDAYDKQQAEQSTPILTDEAKTK